MCDYDILGALELVSTMRSFDQWWLKSFLDFVSIKLRRQWNGFWFSLTCPINWLWARWLLIKFDCSITVFCQTVAVISDAHKQPCRGYLWTRTGNCHKIHFKPKHLLGSQSFNTLHEIRFLRRTQKYAKRPHNETSNDKNIVKCFYRSLHARLVRIS